MANSQNLELALKIKTLVEGVDKLKGLSTDIQKLQGGKQIPDPTKEMRDGIGRTGDQVRQLKNLLGTVLAAVGLSQGLSQLARMTDAYKQFNAQIKLGIGATGDFAAAQADVDRIARDNLVSLEAIGRLYGRMAGPILRLGKSQDEVGKTTEAVALALRISGATAEESASAVLQFSQALASGVLRGEEFNAVNEAAPRLMLALADSMGVPREALRGMAEEGLLTSELLATALPAALGTLRAEAATLPTTVGGSFQVLRNEMLTTVGEADKAVGISATIGRAIQGIADNVAALAAMLTGVLAAAFVGLAAAAVNNIGLIAARMGALLALIGGPVGLVVSLAAAALAYFGFRKSATAELDAVIAKQRELNRLTDKGASPTEATDPRRQQLAELNRQLAEKRRELADAERYQAKNGGSSTGAVAQGIARLKAEINLAEQAIVDLEVAAAKSAAEDAAREAEIRRLMEAAKLAAEKGDKDTKTKPLDKSAFFSDQIGEGQAAADAELEALQRARELMEERAQKQQDFVDALEQEAFLSDLSNDERETAIMLLEAEKLGVTDINRLLELRGEIIKSQQDADKLREMKQEADQIYASLTENLQRSIAEVLNEGFNGDGARGAVLMFVDFVRTSLSNVLAAQLTQGILGLFPKDSLLSAGGFLGLGGKKDGSTPANAIYVQDVAAAAPGADGEKGGLFAGIGDMLNTMMAGLKAGLTSLVSGLGDLLGGLFGDAGGGQNWIGAIASMFGFADGGYTGGGGKYQAAGVVHRGEYVFSSESVRALGLPALDLLHRMSRGIAPPRMPRWGYADGGLVDLPAGGAGGGATNIRIVNAIDPEIAGNFFNSPAGEKTFFNLISRNASAVRNLLA